MNFSLNSCCSAYNTTNYSDIKNKKCEMTFDNNVYYMGILRIMPGDLLMNVHAFSTNASFQHDYYIIVFNYGIFDFKV